MNSLFSNQKSIRNKIIALIMGISTLALIFTLVAFILYDRAAFKQKMVTDLETLGVIISDNSVAALTFFDAASASRTLEALKAEKHIVAAGLFDRGGPCSPPTGGMVVSKPGCRKRLGRKGPLFRRKV